MAKFEQGDIGVIVEMQVDDKTGGVQVTLMDKVHDSEELGIMWAALTMYLAEELNLPYEKFIAMESSGVEGTFLQRYNKCLAGRVDMSIPNPNNPFRGENHEEGRQST